MDSQVASFTELDQLTETISELAHGWGFKRIHGRIWSQLFLSERPLDAADLIAQLDISKALVSISIRELLDVKAVKNVGRSDRGTHLYRANADLTGIAMEVLKKREQVLMSAAQTALQALRDAGTEKIRSHEVSTQQLDALGAQLSKGMDLLNMFVSPNATSAPTPSAAPTSSSSEGPEKKSFTILPNGVSFSLPGDQSNGLSALASNG